MATYTRASAWNNGGTFNNKDLYWYAIGVRAMMNRALNDPASWWFFAAIHGEYVTLDNDPGKLPGWGYIPGVPKVPTAPLPAPNDRKTYWNQCQHQSWFFAPWHRGYLVALEAQLRVDIVQAKGPTDWAIPYWNYFGPNDEFDIPPAFTQQTMPDGSANPLFVTARYGPYANNVVFDLTAAAVAKYPPPAGFLANPITEKCLSDTAYTGSDANTKLPGFGGPLTGFWHGDVYPSGHLESDPHNATHVYVGGIVSDSDFGLMTDPGLAALDPIFYLHHANIDRMWAVWNSNTSNKNPSDENWLKGPAASGERDFIMPMPGNTSWSYVPADVNSLSLMDYTYDNLKPAPSVNLLASRLNGLGVAATKSSTPAEATRKSVELMGTNDSLLPITGTGVSTTVHLDGEVRQKVVRSLLMASPTAMPDRVYLNLENVRGTQDATMLSIFINLPEGLNPSDHPELLAETVALFGLRRASLLDGKHLGGGLSFLVDISPIVDRMHLDNELNADNIRVTIVPNRPLSKSAPITVGRVSIYREGAKS
jgi:tyrosinase